MKRYFNILVGCLLIFSMNSCLYHNLEDLENSSDKKMTNIHIVSYITIRFRKELPIRKFLKDAFVK